MKKTLTIFLSGVFTFTLHCGLFAHEGGRVPLPDEAKIFDAKTFDAYKALAKSNASWQRFTTRNPSWEAWWNPLTQNPHRAWGNPLPIDGYATINQMNAPEAGWKFIRDNAEVLNLNPTDLTLVQAEEGLGKWYIKFSQQYNGLTVLNTFVTLRASPDARVFMMGSDFVPDINVKINPSIRKEAAKEFAKVGLGYREGNNYIEGGGLFILPLKFDTKVEARLVYNYIVNQSPGEVWNTYIDAHTGDVLWRYNLVQNFSHEDNPPSTVSIVKGKVTVNIFPESYVVGARDIPLAKVYVRVNGKDIATDANGEFSTDVGSTSPVPVIARLAGPYAQAIRADGPTASITLSVTPGNDVNITWDNTNSHAAERNAFYHVTAVHDFIRAIDPSADLAALDQTRIANVNINDTCNANWNGSAVNFFRESVTCGNTGTIASVIYHEYGHAINQFYYQKRGGSMTNGALSEGTADIVSNMLTDDPKIGIGFLKNGPNQGIIRNSDNTRRYPENIVNEIHDDGMILAGAVWDVRKGVGLEVAKVISHFVKKGTPNNANNGLAFADYFIEMLIADDDNNNLTDGTPHSSVIIPAFLKHGIPAFINLTHTPIADQSGLPSSGYPIDVTAKTTIITPTSVTLTAQSAKVIWSLDNWKNSFDKSLSASSATDFSDLFPTQKVGSIVRYYIEVADNFGGTLRTPANAPLQSNLFLVGYVTKLFDKMETDDGWKVDPDSDDDAETGMWIRAVPVATSTGSQPGSDHSPGTNETQSWVTGNAAAGTGAGTNDVDGGKTTLRTIAYDLTKYTNPVIRYWRWYSNNLGATPGTDEWVVQISSDDGKTWRDLERTKQAINDWTAMVFPVNDYITPTDKVRVQFIASDYEPGSLIEALIDDFEILDINTSINAAEGLSSPTALSLGQNYPNPFSAGSSGSPNTQISYSLPSESFVTLKVYNTFGQEVKTLVSSTQQPGIHSFIFDASSLPFGMYLYELRTNGQILTKKMMYLR